MNPTMFFDLLETGGPVGMAAVFCFMWWLERKDRKLAQEHTFELATSLIETSVKTQGALDGLTKQMIVCQTRRRD